MTRSLPLALLLTGCVYRVNVEDQSFDVTDPYTRLVVDSDAGDVDVLAGDGDATRVDLELQYHHRQPDVSWDVQGDTLTIEVRCPKVLSPCEVHVAAEVPSEIDAALDTAAGDVTVRSLTGSVDASTGAGDVTAFGLLGELVATTGHGNVTANALASPTFHASTGQGNVDAVFDEVPHDVDVDSGLGNLSLLLPAADYDLDAQSGAGTVTITGLLTDPSSPNHVTAHTGAGNIEIVGFAEPDPVQ